MDEEEKGNNILFLLLFPPLPSGLAVTHIVLCFMKQNTAWDPQTGESWLVYTFNSNPVVIWNIMSEQGRLENSLFFPFKISSSVTSINTDLFECQSEVKFTSSEFELWVIHRPSLKCSQKHKLVDNTLTHKWDSRHQLLLGDTCGLFKNEWRKEIQGLCRQFSWMVW